MVISNKLLKGILKNAAIVVFCFNVSCSGNNECVRDKKTYNIKEFYSVFSREKICKNKIGYTSNVGLYVKPTEKSYEYNILSYKIDVSARDKGASGLDVSYERGMLSVIYPSESIQVKKRENFPNINVVFGLSQLHGNGVIKTKKSIAVDIMDKYLLGLNEDSPDFTGCSKFQYERIEKIKLIDALEGVGNAGEDAWMFTLKTQCGKGVELKYFMDMNANAPMLLMRK